MQNKYTEFFNDCLPQDFDEYSLIHMHTVTSCTYKCAHIIQNAIDLNKHIDTIPLARKDRIKITRLLKSLGV